MEAPYLALITSVAAFVAISIPCLLLAFVCRHRKGGALKPHRRCWSSPAPPPPPLPVSAAAGASELSSWSLYGSAIDSSLKKLSLDDLARATGGFSPDNIIGDGSFGFVYRAVLPGGGGSDVAVKRLSTDHAAAGAGNREFRAELEVLGSLSHPNLARLLGYCAAGRDRLLVYELLERGSLDAWLHGDAGDPLPWPARLRITRGAAAALAFLHHDCHPAVLHRDIKTSNVLLDEDFQAKLADFGLARVVAGSPAVSHVSTQVAGTAGYMAPELREGVGASAKADVYSFGVLMMEVVTGRRPSWPVEHDDEGKEVGLLEWAREKVDGGASLEVVDPRMPAAEAAAAAVRAFLAVAWRCTDESPRSRPAMKEVLEELKKLSACQV